MTGYDILAGSRRIGNPVNSYRNDRSSYPHRLREEGMGIREGSLA